VQAQRQQQQQQHQQPLLARQVRSAAAFVIRLSSVCMLDEQTIAAPHACSASIHAAAGMAAIAVLCHVPPTDAMLYILALQCMHRLVNACLQQRTVLLCPSKVLTHSCGMQLMWPSQHSLAFHGALPPTHTLECLLLFAYIVVAAVLV
jgi:hypothetical protein